MMLVIMIIALLVAIAVPAFLSTRARTQARLCVANLTEIHAAKERWAIENRKTEGDSVDADDISPTYIKVFPTCPGGGTYQIGVIGQNPTCSIGDDHALQ